MNALIGVNEKDNLGTRGDANYSMVNSSGKKIGELSLISKNADVAYIDWIAFDESNRGKGYGTDVINDLISKAKKSGYSRLELNALKDPRPLYERLGFTYQDRSKVNIVTRISEFELGTKRMEYDLKNDLTHGCSELYHYGVKGMKWGRRKNILPSSKPKLRTYGVVKDERSKKSERQKRYEDDYGINPHRTNGTKPRSSNTVRQKIDHGASKSRKVLKKIGRYYAADQIFFGGAGRKAVKSAIQAIGILSISALARARGATDIHWYDKQGNKIV